MAAREVSPVLSMLRAISAAGSYSGRERLVVSFCDEFAQFWGKQPSQVRGHLQKHFGASPFASDKYVHDLVVEKLLSSQLSPATLRELAANETLSSALQLALAGLSKLDLVIVWDGLPTNSDESPISVGEHVGVYDWLVGFCCMVLDRNAIPDLRIFILDMASASQKDDTFASRTFSNVLPRLPWVRSYRPVAMLEDQLSLIVDQCADDAVASEFNLVLRTALSAQTMGFEQLLADLQLGSPLGVSLPMPALNAVQEELAAAVQVLRNLWRNELTRADTRHSVANLVSPVTLAAGLCHRGWPGSGRSWNELTQNAPRAALLSLLDRVGLVTTSEREPLVSLPAARTESSRPRPLTECGDYFPVAQDDPFRRFESIRMLLVDEQCRQGYQQFLSCLLFGDHDKTTDGRVHLAAVESPDVLVESLFLNAILKLPEDATLATSSEQHFLRKLVNFCDQSGICPQVLQKDNDSPLARAVRACRKEIDEAPTSSHDRCAWCGAQLEAGSHAPTSFAWEQPRSFGTHASQNAELDRIEKTFDVLLLDLRLFPSAAPVGDDAPEFDKHLLLPLVLSVFDPSLPIILFSSTQQRTISEAFQHHPNVITAFSKPMASGYMMEKTPSVLIGDILSAMKMALRQHKARGIWRLLQQIAERVPIDINEQPRAFKDNPSGAYVVDQWCLSQLRREFRLLFPAGRYADAVAVPGNILECRGARLGQHPMNDSVALAAAMLMQEKNDTNSWVQAADAVLKNSTLGQRAKDMVCHFVGNAIAEHACRHAQPTQNAILALKNYWKKHAADSHWREGFALAHAIQANELISVRSSAEQMVDQAIEKCHPSNTAKRHLRAEVECLATYQFYSLAAGFRNLRSHYRCRPWDHDQETENHAILVWLWLCKGWLARGEGKAIVSANENMTVAGLARAVARDCLPSTKIDDSSFGASAFTQYLHRLMAMVEEGIFKLEDDLSTACRRITGQGT